MAATTQSTECSAINSRELSVSITGQGGLVHRDRSHGNTLTLPIRLYTAMGGTPSLTTYDRGEANLCWDSFLAQPVQWTASHRTPPRIMNYPVWRAVFIKQFRFCTISAFFPTLAAACMTGSHKAELRTALGGGSCRDLHPA